MILPNTFPIVIALKVLKLGSIYLATSVASNYMTQVYMEKVLVNQENPQALSNFVVMYGIVDLLMSAFILMILYVVGVVFRQDNLDIVKVVAFDFVCGLVAVLILGSIVANTMYNKKYFMYKDDGLRAIRAMKDIMNAFGMLFAIVPFFIALSDKQLSVEKTT